MDGDGPIARSGRVLLELAKGRLIGMVLATAVVGYLAAGGEPGARLAWTLLGTALATGGASALNQWWERRPDALMRRTRGRPLPSGRARAPRVLVAGAAAALAGVAVLGRRVGLAPAALAAGVVLLYVLVYTPLKRRTPVCTLVGAVCGAVPPAIGWTAAGGAGAAPGLGAWLLAAVVFAWQVPHFLALAWVHRRDYERGGFRLLPVVDRGGDLTCGAILLFTMVLPALALDLLLVGLGGPFFALGSLLLGLAWLATGLRLWRQRSEAAARRVFLASLVVLPLLLGLLLVDRGPLSPARGPQLVAATVAAPEPLTPDAKGDVR